ncbi:RHS repeat-associated core domain-containing protein [Salmonella enterica]|nr:RHS repeat-associated core domain-containing protein [Salmonella enterica]
MPEGDIDWQAEYDEWGNVLWEDNPVGLAQLIRLPGQQYDEESGLYYNRHRYYEPGMGRYITQDPIGLAGGGNLYKYPFNSVLRVDPLGLFEDFSAFTNAPGIQYELTKAMFDDSWYTPNSLAFSDVLGEGVTGRIRNITSSISNVEYMGLDPNIKQKGLYDHIADMQFNISGSLNVALTCKAEDKNGAMKEWDTGTTVQLRNMPVKLPLKEPSIPIPGMTWVLWADKLLNTEQFIEQWHKEMLVYGKKLLIHQIKFVLVANFNKRLL